MSKIDCSAEINAENKIIIVNLSASKITLDMSQDIDFTEIVQSLSAMIEHGNEINLTVVNEDSIEDDKHKLVIVTLKEIINKFNIQIKTIPIEEPEQNIITDDDLPF